MHTYYINNSSHSERDRYQYKVQERGGGRDKDGERQGGKEIEKERYRERQGKRDIERQGERDRESREGER